MTVCKMNCQLLRLPFISQWNSGCQHVRHHMLGKAGDLLLGAVGIRRSRGWLYKGRFSLPIGAFCYFSATLFWSCCHVQLVICASPYCIVEGHHMTCFVKACICLSGQRTSRGYSLWKIQGIPPLCCALWTKTSQVSDQYWKEMAGHEVASTCPVLNVRSIFRAKMKSAHKRQMSNSIFNMHYSQ